MVKQISSDTYLARWIRERKWSLLKKVRNGDDESIDSTIKRAAKEDIKIWSDFFTAIFKGENRIDIRFDFKEGRGWDGLTADWATQLFDHLPQNIRLLNIRKANFEKMVWEMLIQRVEKSVPHRLHSIKQREAMGRISDEE